MKSQVSKGQNEAPVAPAKRVATLVLGMFASALIAATPLVACEAGAPATDRAVRLSKPQLDLLEALLFPQGQDQVVRFDELIVSEGKALTPTKWDPSGPLTSGSLEIRTLLRGDFAQAGTGFAKGKPANFVQLYVSSPGAFAGHPERVLETAFGVSAAAGEQMMVVEWPGCIVVASHKRGRISRMASVTSAHALNYVKGEGARSDEIKARVNDCRTRVAAAAVGAWGVFYEPGAAAIADQDSLVTRGPYAGFFESETAEALPQIAPGLSKQRFHELVAGEN